MKVTKTAKGNVKVVLSPDEAVKLEHILYETTTSWIKEEAGMTQEEAQAHGNLSAHLHRELRSVRD